MAPGKVNFTKDIEQQVCSFSFTQVMLQNNERKGTWEEEENFFAIKKEF